MLRSQRKHVMELKSFDFWNSQLIPWITHVAIGTYIGPGKESEHICRF